MALDVAPPNAQEHPAHILSMIVSTGRFSLCAELVDAHVALVAR